MLYFLAKYHTDITLALSAIEMYETANTFDIDMLIRL